MEREQLRRELSEAVAAYQRDQGFLGIEHLPDDIEQLGDASYAHHARELRDALTQKDSSAVLRELILVLAKPEGEST